jgi:phosphoribosylanthranilate isomerase
MSKHIMQHTQTGKTMIVQIYGVTTPEDGKAVAALGANRIGLVLCDDPALTHDGVSDEEAKAILAAQPPNITVCGLTFSTNPDEIEQMVRTIKPHVLHLTITPDLFPIKVIRKLKQRLPGLQIMQAITVLGLDRLTVHQQSIFKADQKRFYS